MFKAYVLLADKSKHEKKEVEDYEGIIFQDFEHMDDELYDTDLEYLPIENFCRGLNDQELDLDNFWVSYVYVVYEG